MLMNICHYIAQYLLGFDRRMLTNTNEEEKELRRSHGGNALRVTQVIALIPPPLERGAHAGLFIEGVQQSCYNTLNVPNYLPRQ
jgi:hypothetical protein